MKSCSSIVIALVALVGQSTSFLQPGIVPIPSLPSNFSKLPEHWVHTTPLLDTVNTIIPLTIPSFRRRDANHRYKNVTHFWRGWEDVHYLFSFGDSYTSTSFNPAGEQPSRSNPLGNPVYPGATSSDGPNYIDFLTTTYNHSYVEAYNFGFGGATINYSIVPDSFGTIVQSFADQVQKEFLPTYSNNTNVPWRSSNSLFTIFFGINDCGISYLAGNGTVINELIQSYQTIVDQLYAAGARNFVFVNVPPVDRSPSTIQEGSLYQAAEAAYIASFNVQLRALVHGMGSRHPDSTSFLFDANSLFAEVLDNPSQFTETVDIMNTTACCEFYENGTPTLTYLDPACYVPVNEYFWLNGLHPTYPIHNFVASQIVQLLGTVA